MNIVKTATPLLLIAYSVFAWAERTSDVQLLEDFEDSCGEKVEAEEVLVLDLEPYEQKLLAAEFIQQHVEEYQLATRTPVLIPKVLSDTRNAKSVMLRQTQLEAASRGCNLVIVQAVEIVENDHVTVAVSHTSMPGGFGRSDYSARVNLGYALILMGTRIN